jgi:hypothetical protein
MEADRRLPAVGFERQQALAQHLLTLQHKAGVLCRDPTPGALRGCVRAAGEFESWLSDFETGLPGLQLALCQVRARRVEQLGKRKQALMLCLICMVLQDSFQAAQASQALARQLSADAVSTLDHLCSGREGKVVSEDAGWLLSRPLLRLLLWLLPVHVPAETPAQPPEPESAAGLSTDWKQGFAASYVRDVATVSLVCLQRRRWYQHLFITILSSSSACSMPWSTSAWLPPVTLKHDFCTAATTCADVLAAPAC